MAVGLPHGEPQSRRQEAVISPQAPVFLCHPGSGELRGPWLRRWNLVLLAPRWPCVRVEGVAPACRRGRGLGKGRPRLLPERLPPPRRRAEPLRCNQASWEDVSLQRQIYSELKVCLFPLAPRRIFLFKNKCPLCSGRAEIPSSNSNRERGLTHREGCSQMRVAHTRSRFHDAPAPHGTAAARRGRRECSLPSAHFSQCRRPPPCAGGRRGGLSPSPVATEGGQSYKCARGLSGGIFIGPEPI